MVVADATSISPHEARSRAQEFKLEVARGRDPLPERHSAKATAVSDRDFTAVTANAAAKAYSTLARSGVGERYLPIVEAIEEEVLETEQRTLDAFLEREEIGRLFTLRRELIRFQRVLGPMHEVCNKLTHVSLPALDREVRPYFQDVLDHVRRVETRVGGLREILTSVFEAARIRSTWAT
jgi:Mg2+ and Co2+ transporter CorA